MSGYANDLFEQLLEASWRGIPFPVSHLRTEISHDHAVHARPDRDGARIEATGRRPLTVSFTALFQNNIVQGKNETWGGKPMYPEQHVAYMAACADRSTGTFVHPARGAIRMKVVSAVSTLQAERRGGEDVETTLIESTETEAESDSIFTAASPIAEAIIAAVSLDATLGEIDPDPRLSAPDDGQSLEEGMRQVQGVFDKVNLIGRQVTGVFKRFEGKLNAIEAAINRVGDVGTWPQKLAIQKMREAVRLAQLAAEKQNETRIYVVPGRTTIGALSSKLRNTPGELLTLNRGLAGAPAIEARSVVRHYPRAA